MKNYLLQVHDDGQTVLTCLEKSFPVAATFHIETYEMAKVQVPLEDALDCISRDHADTQDEQPKPQNELRQIQTKWRVPVTEAGHEYRRLAEVPVHPVESFVKVAKRAKAELKSGTPPKKTRVGQLLEREWGGAKNPV